MKKTSKQIAVRSNDDNNKIIYLLSDHVKLVGGNSEDYHDKREYDFVQTVDHNPTDCDDQKDSDFVPAMNYVYGTEAEPEKDYTFVTPVDELESSIQNPPSEVRLTPSEFYPGDTVRVIEGSHKWKLSNSIKPKIP